MYLTRMDFKNYDLAVITETREEGKRAMNKEANRVGQDWCRPSVYETFTAWFDDVAWCHEVENGVVVWP